MAISHGGPGAHGHGPAWARLVSALTGRHVQADEHNFTAKIWTLVAVSTLGGTASAIITLLAGQPVFTIFSCLMVIMGCLIYQKGWIPVKPDPPQVGLLVKWNKRYPVVFTEGWILLAPYWPFNVGLIIMDAKESKMEFSFEVDCISGYDQQQQPIMGAMVSFKIGLTHQLDYKGPQGGDNCIRFINKGGKDQVDATLKQEVEARCHDYGTLYTWNEVLALRVGINAALIMHLADSKFRLLRDANGELLSEADICRLERDPVAYYALPEVRGDALEYQNDPTISKEERVKRTRELAAFLKIVGINGGGNVMNLGTRLARLEVLESKPEEKLARAADIPAVRKIEEETAASRARTLINTAKVHLEASKEVGEPMSWADCIKQAEVDLGRATEIVGGGRAIVVAQGNKRGGS